MDAPSQLPKPIMPSNERSGERPPRLVTTGLRSSPRVVSVDATNANPLMTPQSADVILSADDQHQEELAPRHAPLARRSSDLDYEPDAPRSVRTSHSSSSSTRTSSPPGRSILLPQLPELTRSTSTVDPSSAQHLPRTPTSTTGPHILPRSSSLPSSVQRGGSGEFEDKWRTRDGHIHSPSCSSRSRHSATNATTERAESVAGDDSSEWEDIVDDEDANVNPPPDADAPPAWTYEMPTQSMVRDAAEITITDEWGTAIPFGDLLPGSAAHLCASNDGEPPSRLVVFFIGHWWCGLCHDYALASVAKLSPAALIRDGVQVIMVSSGSWKVIAKYRAMFHVPFPVYVDRGTRLFRALGMRQAMPNPFAEARRKNRPGYHRHKFVRQMVTGMMNGVFRLGGIQFKNPGSFTQLGGEFVFSSGFECEFAHRMTGRADHCEAPDVLQAVGVDSGLGAPVCSLPESDDEEKKQSLKTRLRRNRTRKSSFAASGVTLHKPVEYNVGM